MRDTKYFRNVSLKNACFNYNGLKSNAQSTLQNGTEATCFYCKAPYNFMYTLNVYFSYYICIYYKGPQFS